MLTFPPDISFVIQIASFFVLWLGLKRLLFDPVLRVLEEREARTAGARQTAADMQAAAQTLETEHERRMLEIRQRLAAEMDTLRSDTLSEEQRILAETRQQANQQLMHLRDSLRRQADEARTAVASEARDLASRIVTRVVGRPLG